jgi:hypothetical protein
MCRFQYSVAKISTIYGHWSWETGVGPLRLWVCPIFGEVASRPSGHPGSKPGLSGRRGRGVFVSFTRCCPIASVNRVCDTIN